MAERAKKVPRLKKNTREVGPMRPVARREVLGVLDAVHGQEIIEFSGVVERPGRGYTSSIE